MHGYARGTDCCFVTSLACTITTPYLEQQQFDIYCALAHHDVQVCLYFLNRATDNPTALFIRMEVGLEENRLISVRLAEKGTF